MPHYYETGTELDDTIVVEASDPFNDYYHIDGAGGDDVIGVRGAALADLRGGSGDDLLWATGTGEANLRGDGGADILIGGAGNNTYYADRDDTLVETGGRDHVVIARNYTLQDGFEDLDLYGSTARAGTGNALDNAVYAYQISHGLGVILSGLGGDDHLIGSRGNDVLRGGAGDDLLEGSGGVNTFQGGKGVDFAMGLGGYGPLEIDLRAGLARFIDHPGWKSMVLNSIEGVSAGGTDTVLGGDGDNIIRVGFGASHVTGRGGADLLQSDGKATYHYDRTADSTVARHDTIQDFHWAGSVNTLSDFIDVSAIDANVTKAGNQAFVFGGTGKGHLWTADAGDGNSFVYANTDDDAALELAILVTPDENSPDLGFISEDFIL